MSPKGHREVDTRTVPNLAQQVLSSHDGPNPVTGGERRRHVVTRTRNYNGSM